MFFRPARSRALVAAIMGGALASSTLAGRVIAEPAPPYLELLRRAQGTSPRLAESEADVRRAAGLATQAGVRPNPVIGLEAEDFGGSKPYGGIDRSQFTLSASQAFELGAKRPARIEAGAASIQAARLLRDQQRSDFALLLATAYLQTEVAQRRSILADAALELAIEDARIAQVLVTSGKEAELRGLQAQTVVSTARAESGLAQAERSAALSSLTALAGSDVAFTSLGGSLLQHADRIEAIQPIDPLETPSYLAAKAQRDAAAKRVRVERTRATPDLTVSVGVRRIQESDATDFVAGVSMPIPVFDQNRGNVSAARAELQGAEARLNAARLDAEATIRSSTARLAASQARVAAAHDAERTGQEAYRLTRLGYQAGKLPLIEVLTARRSVSEAALQTLTASVERLNAEAELARLQGRTPFGDQP